MKALKKITAIALAAATAATMTVTASAANFTFKTTGTTYSHNTSDNYIYYKDLDSFTTNKITFETQEKSMMEGNSILTVDFAKDPTARRKIIADSTSVYDYMDSLRIKGRNNSRLGNTRYVLEVVDGARTTLKNVMVVPSYVLTDNFNITGASLESYAEPYTNKPSTTQAWLYVDFKINDHHILLNDSDLDVYGTISNYELLRLNFSNAYTDDVYTTGRMRYLVDLKPFVNSTKSVELIGNRIGTITIPKLPNVNAWTPFSIGFHRFYGGLKCTYKNY